MLHLACADNTDTERDVRKVMALQRPRFAQRAMLRVRLPARSSLT